VEEDLDVEWKNGSDTDGDKAVRQDIEAEAQEVDSDDDTDMLHAHANHTPAGGGMSRSVGEAASNCLLSSTALHPHKHSSVVPWTSTSRARSSSRGRSSSSSRAARGVAACSGHVADAHVQARFERYGLGHVCAGYTAQFTCFTSTKVQILTPQLQMCAVTSALNAWTISHT
jgi:hypothetical protein